MKPTIGQLRYSEEAKRLSRLLSGETDAKMIASLLISLLRLPTFQEKYGAIKYCESTGKALENDWAHLEQWDGRLWIGYTSNGPYISSTDVAYQAIKKLVGKAILSDENVYLLISYARMQNDSGHGIYDGGLTPAYFKCGLLDILIP